MSNYDIGMRILLQNRQPTQARIGELTPQGGLVVGILALLGTFAILG